MHVRAQHVGYVVAAGNYGQGGRQRAGGETCDADRQVGWGDLVDYHGTCERVGG